MAAIITSVIPLVLTLLAVVFVIYLSYLFSRYIAGGRGLGMGKTKYMKIIDRIVVGQDKYAAIIQIGSKYFLMSVTTNDVKIMKELSDSDLIELDFNKADKDQPSESFKDVLKKSIKKK